MNGNGDRSVEDFLHDLRKMMLHEWGWTPADTEAALPKLIAIFLRVGILQASERGYEVTGLVEDDAAWKRAWALVEAEGIGEGKAS